MENAAKQGKKILDGLKTAFKDNPHVKEVRGKGLLIGIELDCECREIMNLAIQNGLIFNVTNLSTLRILPPLIMTDEQAQMLVDMLVRLVREFYANK